MNKRWLSNLKGEEKDKLRSYLLSCAEGFKRLDELLAEELDETIKEMSNGDNYSSPAWAEKHADRLGRIRTLRKVKDLIKL